MKALRLTYLSAAFLLVGIFGCTSPFDREAGVSAFGLGKAHLQVTGAREAIPYFEKGLLLLHSFEYDDARESFQRARELDSSFVMAYWGEAMTCNHPLWRQQNYEEGQAALARLAPTAEERQARCRTELERDLMHAVEILYGEGDKFERDKAYTDAMGLLYGKYPGNQEVAAFYALSLLGSVPVGRDEETYSRSAAIVKGILAENPDHPGALHYLIHSYDDPGHARLALAAADSYAEVAPGAAHALHMPSHIYVAMGMWHEVVASNIDSWEASVERMNRKGLDNDARSYHALHWLLYGYLQQGQYEKAAGLLNDMVGYTRELPSSSARDYLINMKGNYLVESEDWFGEPADIAVNDREDLNIVTRAVYYFVEGMKAYRRNQPQVIRAALDQLAGDREKSSFLVSGQGLPMCNSAGASLNAPNKQDIEQAGVMEFQLRALLALVQNKTGAAEDWMRQAVELQEATSYNYGPPAIVCPAYEMYGQWLLGQNRPEEALAQFDLALHRGPKRVRALQGKLSAARQLGKEEIVEEVQQTLQEIRIKAEEGATAKGDALSMQR